ncbi:unnamed protein product (macronuclear) [Paramecium tetraurelia]|uniref:Uncharacterized protein n=1 Tax=Paramecium tetraurelia TaxID=5888 RepID=A0DLR0_PARTE|nr:uncharacterized protein GSPATT00039609001 [Paramecium tetraurelia]CAK83977.1 unnamed protein product [Paramecium tetraurelia]|eukprot:XP_001451374.1 hypothetical protein (macronuclear) [Paramecium tetraurelia strain d4-2]
MCSYKVIINQKMMRGPKYQQQNIQELCRSKFDDDDDPEIDQNVRVDRFGNPINKKLKFRICFRDEILPSQQVFDIRVVENWKLYNLMEEKEEADACCKQFCQII